MAPDAIAFPPFQLDLRNAQLRRGNATVAVRPKTFAVLCRLAERPGELVTKESLLDAVWAGVAVTEDVVRISVRELRTALGDDRAHPRFIETVPRRGYRFIAATGAPAADANAPPEPANDLIVGRAGERARIAEWMRAAAGGARQLVFVTGEAGIGKTTLVDTALRESQRSPTEVRVARGQCVEHYGGGSPYEPVLEALSSLCRGPDGESIKSMLRRSAPRWLLDLLGASSATLPDRVDAESHVHMLHMLAKAIADLAEETPLILVFEDVHWSDYSTLDLISVLAQGRDPTRLLVLCTLRGSEAIVRHHPIASVKRELLRKGRCHELLVGGLPAADVAQYLSERFRGVGLPAALMPLLVERSDGNPFFVVTLVDHLLESGMLVSEEGRFVLRGGVDALRTSIPDGLRAVIEPRLDRLDANELRVLEAASGAGLTFAAHAIAAAEPSGGVLADVEVVEDLCDALVRRQEILRADGEATWPDGTTSARYAFRHVLYRQVIEQRLTTTARRRLHQRIGETLEAAHFGRTPEVASELAAHFESSRDVVRAVRYHGEAAAEARARFAHQETRFHVDAALDLMRGQPETSDGLRQRLPMLDDLGWTSFAARGWGDERAASAFAQMREIAERLDKAEARFKAMEGELIVHTMRAEYATARRYGEEMLELAEQIGNRYAIAGALAPIGATAIHMGEIGAAQSIAERGCALGNPDEPTIQAASCRMLLASTFTYQGRIAAARATHREALALAAKSDAPYILAHVSAYSASDHQLFGDVPRVRELAVQAERIANQLGFTVLESQATLYRAWCEHREGGGEAALTTLRTAFDAYVASGQRISTTSYALVVVDACLAAGDLEQASSLLDFAARFCAETGERLNEHEIHRLRGECLLAGPASRARRASAAGCFERAMEVAASQGALLFELRAAVGLHQVKPKDAKTRLERLLARFGPEDDHPTLRAATALLAR